MLPLLFIIILIQWAVIFLKMISSWVFYSVSFFFGVSAILGFAFEAFSGQETVQMLFTAFLVFLIPQIVNWIIVKIMTVRYILTGFIK